MCDYLSWRVTGNAALVLGIKSAALRQWRHRRDIIFVNL
jgi:hypothetical protein